MMSTEEHPITDQPKQPWIAPELKTLIEPPVQGGGGGGRETSGLWES